MDRDELVAKLRKWLDKGNKAQDIAVQQWLEVIEVGFEQNQNAKMLEEKHWLEAIDPLHRYGTNLGFYFKEWEAMRGCKMAFFEWLDRGGGVGKDMQQCGRRMLDEQKVLFLRSAEARARYEVRAENGRIYYKASRIAVETNVDEQWIYVLSPLATLYVAKKEKGFFHHSTFLAGAPILAAGFIQVSGGIITWLNSSSGHYKPREEHFRNLIQFLVNQHVDILQYEVSQEEKGVICLKRVVRLLANQE